MASILRKIVPPIALLLCFTLFVSGAEPTAATSIVQTESTEGRALAPQEASLEGSAAVPQPLTDEEATELSARAEDPGPEVAGGALSNEHLTYIVIALAAMVLVLIAK